MLNSDKIQKIESVLNMAPVDAMSSRAKRRRLGLQISNAIGMFNGRVYDFVEEMDGLDFHNMDDRLVFLEFAAHGL